MHRPFPFCFVRERAVFIFSCIHATWSGILSVQGPQSKLLVQATTIELFMCEQTVIARKAVSQMVRNLILCSTLLCLLSACRSGDSAEEVKAPPLTAREAVIQSLPVVEIQLKSITPETLPAEIEKHRGKVVFVDYWATWCPMCLDSFHHLSEWHQEYAGQGLVILAINLDEDNESNRKVVKEYLTEYRAPFENFICSAAPDTKPVEKFGIEGSTLPFCQIFNREGELVVALGNVNPDHLYDQRSISAALTTLFPKSASTENNSK